MTHYTSCILAEEMAQPKTVQDRSYWKAAFHPSFVFLTLGFFFRLIGNYGNQIWNADGRERHFRL